MADRVWTPHPGQQTAFLCAREDEVLYGGAAGGGKTDGLLGWMIARRLLYPGTHGLYLRRKLKTLQDPKAAIPRSKELLHGIAEWNGSLLRWTFPNGSTFQFGHCHHEDNRLDYHGAQPDDLAWDELTEFTELIYTYISGRVRTTVPGFTPQVRAATNPIGVGTGWVRARFVDLAPGGGRTIWLRPSDDPEQPPTASLDRLDGETVSTARFIPSRVQDNLTLMRENPRYLIKLMNLPEAERRALLDGDWDAFAGSVFREWNRAVHVVPPFPIPAHWERRLGVDYGYRQPYCALWLARDPLGGGLYVYREAYQANLTGRDQAEQIKRLEQESGEWPDGVPLVRKRLADPSMWNKQNVRGVVSSIAQDYHDLGVRVEPAQNNRVVGKNRVHDAFRHTTHPTTGELLGAPELRIFSTCYHLISTLPYLQYDPNGREDVDTTGDDHAYDALKYVLLSWPSNHASTPRHHGHLTSQRRA